MKATGIVRRIDDLGRIVVPKEIRRTLRIREGDPLEIFTISDGSVVLKKYSPIGELSEYAEEFVQSMKTTLDTTCIICDKDVVVAASGDYKKDYIGKSVSRQLEQAIELRTTQVKNNASGVEFIPVTEGEDVSEFRAEVVRPIICEGQTIGAVVLLSKTDRRAFGEVEAKSAEVAALFMGRQMEQ